jgi:hypothetical protein
MVILGPKLCTLYMGRCRALWDVVEFGGMGQSTMESIYESAQECVQTPQKLYKEKQEKMRVVLGGSTMELG